MELEIAPTYSDVSSTEDFFEMSLDNLCVAGLDGYFKRVNPAWSRTLGWTAAELMSRPSIEFVHPDDRALTLGGRERLRAGNSMGPLTNRYLCKDGSFRWFEWRSIAHLDRGLVYAAARDITPQKLIEERLAHADERERRLERQLTIADRMASIGTLAGGVAHEINNPLASVTANVSMMIEELAREDCRLSELREMAGAIQGAAERIRQVVHGLKTFSRADEERRGAIDLCPLLDLAADLTLSQKRDRVRLVKDYGETPWIEADEARLGQVFINLLVNAAQALPEAPSGSSEIRIATMTDAAGRAVVEISDNGTGIPESVLPRIFDPFFTTKAVGVGTGLGLSICHSIVTRMGGQISAASEPGRGTTFSVVLPGVAAERSGVAASPPVRPAAEGAAILVVDDDLAVGTVLARVLRGHEVTVVSRAKKAIEILEAGNRFEVIFCDLMMPEMSGMDFYDDVAQRFPDAAQRMVFMSGGAFTPSARAFLDRVTNARMSKPFDPLTVRSLVQQSLDLTPVRAPRRQ